MTHAEMGSTALWLMLLLGAYHGINPGMGWLFAVALGMQEQKGGAVARALVPIALGHALSIASGGHPLSRRRASVRPWHLFPGASLPSAMGSQASGLSRLDGLVVSDGIG